MAVAIAIALAFRSLLRHGFMPILLVVTVLGVTYASGLFEQATSHYLERGTEETGRGPLWPAATQRFLASPLVGVGVSNIATYMPERRDPIASPHNSFLYFALSSGILPLSFFIVFWIQAVRASFSHVGRLGDGVFRIPFLVFAFSSAMLGDLGFLSPWGLLAISVGAGSGICYGTDRAPLIRRSGRLRAAQPLGRRSWNMNPVPRSRREICE